MSKLTERRQAKLQEPVGGPDGSIPFETNMEIRQAPIGPRRFYKYAPLEDITAFETALLLEFVAVSLSGGDVDKAFDKLPEACRRHLDVTDQ